MLAQPSTGALCQHYATDPYWQLPAIVTCFHPAIGPVFSAEAA